MKFVFLSLFIIFFSACNLNQDIAIRGVDLHTHEEGGDSYVDLEAILSLGNLKLPNSTIPIQNPDKQNIGEATIQQLDDGTSRIALTVNLSDAANLDPALGKTLPNGREIPSLLGNEVSLTGIPVLEKSRVYVGGNPKSTLVAGIALNAPALDHILMLVKNPLNLFLSFPLSSEVSGVAGLYSSPNAGQNGVAVFAKKSQQETNTLATGLTELNKVNRLALFRLNYLLTRHATIRIK